MDPTTLLAIAKAVLPWAIAGGAAYGGVKQGLNGTRERMKSIDEKLDTHIRDDHEIQTQMVEGLTQVSTKLDTFIDLTHKRD